MIKQKRKRDELYIPNEIWSYILWSMSWNEVIRYRKVCKLWNYFIKNDMKYFETYYPDYICDIYPNITKLAINGIGDINCLSRYKHLRKIIIKNIELSNLNLHRLKIQSLVWVCNNKTSIKCLEKILMEILLSSTITKFKLVGKYLCCNNCIPYYGKIKNIKKLEIINSKNISYKILEELINLPNLNILKLINSSFRGTEQNDILNILLNIKSLNYLYISKNMFDTIGNKFLEMKCKDNNIILTLV